MLKLSKIKEGRMEEIYNKIIVDSEDYISPYSNEWKNTYNFAADYLKENKLDYILEKLDSFVKTLVISGDVYENVVMDTAIYYFLCVKANFKPSNIKVKNPISEGLNILLTGNLDKIFKSETYKYLNKIMLSFLINELNNKDSNKIVENMQIIKDGQEILKKYEKNCNGRLLKLLKNCL